MQLSFSDLFRSPLKRMLVRGLERLTGVRRLQQIYAQRQQYLDQGLDVFSAAMQLLKLKVEVRGYPLALLPRTQPAVFAANHPHGFVDGLVSCHLIHQVRTDFRVMVINPITHIEEIRPWVLPIDFTATAEGQKNNLRSRAKALKFLQGGGAIVIYPAGSIATAPWVFGRAVERPWHPFLGRLVQSSRACVIPLYVHGQNSWRFHLADRLGTPVRMAMLMKETCRLIGTTIAVTVGEPIAYETLEASGDRRELVEFLRRRTLDAGGTASAAK